MCEFEVDHHTGDYVCYSQRIVCWFFNVPQNLLESLRNGNENGKKPIGLDWQNNHFARASRFFVPFLAVVARLQRERAKFHVLSRTGTQNNNFFFLFLNFDTIL